MIADFGLGAARPHVERVGFVAVVAPHIDDCAARELLHPENSHASGNFATVCTLLCRRAGCNIGGLLYCHSLGTAPPRFPYRGNPP